MSFEIDFKGCRAILGVMLRYLGEFTDIDRHSTYITFKNPKDRFFLTTVLRISVQSGLIPDFARGKFLKVRPSLRKNVG